MQAHNWLLGLMPRKNSEIHIDVSHSRQPLVKGERLVRYEVNAVMIDPEQRLPHVCCQHGDHLFGQLAPPTTSGSSTELCTRVEPLDVRGGIGLLLFVRCCFYLMGAPSDWTMKEVVG